ncbi:hypothetical protein FO519_009682 [Halicephalobus sp. NKZ332]|nr:hypothetical protein FO519_009682 [Halicephalobus sp. NKZ332]
MENANRMWLFDEEMDINGQKPEAPSGNSGEMCCQQTCNFQQFPQEPSFSSSNPNQPGPSHNFAVHCDIRRGRPLIRDDEHEPERVKQRRYYARCYRKKIRSEKCKLLDENEKLKDIIQRMFSLYTRTQSPTFVLEFQKIQQEFIVLCSANLHHNVCSLSDEQFSYRS